MKILYLVPHVPYPLVRPSCQRKFFLLKELAKSHDVDLFCLDSEGHRKENVLPVFKEFCRRVQFFPFEHQKRPPFFWRMADPIPAAIQHWNNSHVLAKLNHFIGGQKYDLVHFTDLVLWQYVKKIRTEGIKVVDRSHLDFTKELETLKTARFSMKELVTASEAFVKMKAYEKKALNGIDLTIVGSWENERVVHEHLHQKAEVKVIQNGVDPGFFDRQRFPSTPEAEPTVIFCGSLDHPGNVHGLGWYFREVDPVFRKLVPSRKVWIVGVNPSEEVQQMRMIDGVELFPDVPDVRPYYQKAWLQMIPLRTGSTTGLKLMESLCIGCPVVTTAKGAEGLNHLRGGTDLLVSNSPKAFAHSMERVVRNSTVRNSLIENGRRGVLENYTWEILGKELSALYLRLKHPLGVL